MRDKFRASRQSLSQTAFIGLMAAAIGAFFFLLGLVYFYVSPISLTMYSPKQPIPFSHKLHAGENKIPCQYCHSDARRSESAGVPGAQKCMNCHNTIKSESPEILKVAAAIEKGKPIEWIKVFVTPDHVWFSHKRHIKKDVACQTCHGKVETMEVVGRAVDHKMGFCLDCHREKGAPTDCWTCHT